jgi:ribose transport system substrate-binding protein
VHRLLYTLEQCGVVEKIGNDQYRLTYRRVAKKKWKIGYGAPGIDTLCTKRVTESLRGAVENCGEIELLMLGHRYKAAVTLRNAEQFVRQREDLVIEYQIDEQTAAIVDAPTPTPQDVSNR